MAQEVKDNSEELKSEEIAQEEQTEEQEPEEESEQNTETEEEDPKVLVAEAKDKYLRLYSEFENFRRRTAKERIDLISTASKDLIVDLLPVLDDFERALKTLEGDEHKSAREGMELIANKFQKTLDQKGLKEIEVKPGSDFDEELHEAITQIPAPTEDLAGKIVDVVEKGYLLGEKVIRFAKVVTGASK